MKVIIKLMTLFLMKMVKIFTMILLALEKKLLLKLLLSSLIVLGIIELPFISLMGEKHSAGCSNAEYYDLFPNEVRFYDKVVGNDSKVDGIPFSSQSNNVPNITISVANSNLFSSLGFI